jgi:tetratricopeptide (TPR) repeat protein
MRFNTLCLTSIVLVLALTTTARANALSDASAGLATLQSGDNDGAIALFTRALNEGLRGDDKEFAYASRGKAYLNKADFSDAIADLDRARQMKPDDNDAQNDLIAAISQVQPANMVTGRSASSYANEFGNAIARSLLGGLAASLQQQTGQAMANGPN